MTIRIISHCDSKHPHVLKTLKRHYDYVTFYGCNSLCFASFAKQLVEYRKRNKEFAARSFVYIYGYDNRKHAVTKTIGVPLSGKLDGFIRNFKVLPLEEMPVSGKISKPLSVGCIDATLEDIACFEATFYFLDLADLDTWVIQDGYFSLHADCSTLWPKDLNPKLCDNAVVLDHYNISKAKLTGDRKGAEILARYLRDKWDITLSELAAESMKSFRRSCEKDNALSKYMVNQIRAFINRAAYQKNKRLGTVVVYALEALLFVSHGPLKERTAAFVMDKISYKSVRNLHPHVLWAGLVTIQELARQGSFLNRLRMRQSTLITMKVVRRIHKSRKGPPGFRRLLTDMLNMLDSPRIDRPPRYHYDAFLSYVSEDKEDIVVPFYKSMKKRNLRPWFDPMEPGWGKQIDKKIQEGIRECKLFIVFITEAFLKRHSWASRELSIALSIEQRVGRRFVLPIVIGISRHELTRRLPWFTHDKIYKQVSVKDWFSRKRLSILREIMDELQEIIKADC